MKFNPDMPGRKHLRLKQFDYSQDGCYFITICVKNWESVFGEIEKNVMILNDYGRIANSQWLFLCNQYEYIQLHEYCIMPNHFHGIIEISAGNGRDRSLQKKIKSLPELIGVFKTTSSKHLHKNGLDYFQWQKSYYDHIIRDEDDFSRIRDYIIHNPVNWNNDENNPKDI